MYFDFCSAVMHAISSIFAFAFMKKWLEFLWKTGKGRCHCHRRFKKKKKKQDEKRTR